VDDSTSARSPSFDPSSGPLPAGAGGGVFGQSLEPELGPSFSSPTSALVETSSQLADIPCDPMSCEWGVMSKPGSPAVVLQGGDERRGVACWEPELVVDRRSEASQRTFDPMLVEVCLRLGSLAAGAAAPTSLGVLEARESPVLSGPDEPRVDVEDCGMLEADNGTTSASGPGLENVLQPMAEDMEEPSAHSTVVTVADEVAQVANPSA
jgi:hypothetical protein